jgi:PAS domain-containing protein
MQDDTKSKEQHISELIELRRRIDALEMSGSQTRRSAERLEESEAGFRNLLDYIPGISIQGYTTDGTVRYWNKASEEVYGYTEKEALGRNLGDLIIPPERRPHFREALKLGSQATGTEGR